MKKHFPKILLFVAILATAVYVPVFAVTTYQTTTGDTPTKPDLLIKSVTFKKNTALPILTIKNNSIVKAGKLSRSFKVSYLWTDVDGKKILSAAKWNPSLAARGVRRITLSSSIANKLKSKKQPTNLTIKVDSGNLIDELFENNNTWKGAIPGFTPPVTHTPPSDGNGTTTPSNPEDPTYTVNPPATCTEDIWTCGDWNTCSADGLQTRTCTMTFDCQDSITPVRPSESQTCTPPPPVAPDLSALPRANCMVSVEPDPIHVNADLVIKSGSVSHTWLNTSIKFIATIINNGPDSTTTAPKVSENVYSDANNGDSDLYLCIDTNGDGLWDFVTTTYNGPLDPQHTSFTSARWTTPLSGTHNYQICTDGGNKVIENDETNNCYSGTITLP